jgi:hypothetical protein
MALRGQRQALAALLLGNKRYPLYGCWVGPRTGLDCYGKSSPPRGFDPRTVQSVASHYTD